jgi:hypothetical protein
MEGEFTSILIDAECLGDVDDDEVENYIHNRLIDTYPKFFNFNVCKYEVNIERIVFENDYDDEEDTFVGYAVYLHFHKNLLEKLVEHVIDKNPVMTYQYITNMY